MFLRTVWSRYDLFDSLSPDLQESRLNDWTFTVYICGAPGDSGITVFGHLHLAQCFWPHIISFRPWFGVAPVEANMTVLKSASYNSFVACGLGTMGHVALVIPLIRQSKNQDNDAIIAWVTHMPRFWPFRFSERYRKYQQGTLGYWTSQSQTRAGKTTLHGGRTDCQRQHGICPHLHIFTVD